MNVNQTFYLSEGFTVTPIKWCLQKLGTDKLRHGKILTQANKVLVVNERYKVKISNTFAALETLKQTCQHLKALDSTAETNTV